MASSWTRSAARNRDGRQGVHDGYVGALLAGSGYPAQERDQMATAKPQQHGPNGGARGLIGRREQLAVLEEAVPRAETGEPQFVVVSGDAGGRQTPLLSYRAAPA